MMSSRIRTCTQNILPLHHGNTMTSCNLVQSSTITHLLINMSTLPQRVNRPQGGTASSGASGVSGTQKSDDVSNTQMTQSRDNQQQSRMSDPISSALSLFRDPFFGLSDVMRLPERLHTNLMKVDVKEGPSEFIVTADVPGVNKDQIKVELDEDNLLHIGIEASSEHKDEGEREGWKYHHLERSSSAQHRSLKLPQNVDASAISAVSENGVLKVTIPKTTTQADARRRITIS